MRRTLILFLGVVGLASCKKEVTDKVDQDKIFTEYLLKYNQNTDVTLASATFRFSNLNGTRLMLADPSSVTVDSEDMEWSEEEGNYQKEFSGFKPTASFNWVDLDGNSFTNSVDIQDIDFPATVNDLNRADSISYFSWAGPAPLDSSELVRLTVDGPGDTDARIFKVDTIGATVITIDSLKLSQVDSGMVTLILEKVYSPELVESTVAGGLRVGIYRPTDVSVNLN